jgi:riboflavin kinase/FMN adenylyltransferase
MKIAMKIIRGHNLLSNTQKNTVVTIGNFDGVHLGHQRIIEIARKHAQDRGGEAIAYTFRPHPQVALRPDTNIQLLSTYDEKLEQLEALGLDMVIEEPFSRNFSTIEPDRFFSDIILRKLNASEIVVGYDFAFGKGREGHLESLEAFCKESGVALTVVPPHRVPPGTEGEIVSSSRIRQHLLDGKIEEASRLLGRPFSYKGVVIKGEQRGRKLGFPTANLKLEDKLALPDGVYATWAKVTGDPTVYPSVTNVGVRPTFEGLGHLVETHLLDVTLDLYGRTLEVLFVKRLRAERKFSGPDFMNALKTQIGLDANEARELLKKS